MTSLRLSFLLLATLVLTACAGHARREAAPTAAADAAVGSPAEPDAAPADTSDTALAPPATDAAQPAVAGDNEDAEDDYAALYGGTASGNGRAAQAAASGSVYDPWEPMNRRIHAFNMGVDRMIARPLATAYVNVVPRPARLGVNNFFGNLGSPLTMVNQLLQGRPGDAWTTLARFLMNSTLGVGGLFDPATKALLPRRSEDFGQTMGTWGWRNSRYLELPFFGPRTLRDAFGLVGDAPLSPLRQVEEDKVRFALQGLQLVDTRVQLMPLDELRDSAPDEYALTRDAWVQRRNYQIQNDLRRSRDSQDDLPDYLHEDDHTVPVDAMPIPNWGR